MTKSKIAGKGWQSRGTRGIPPSLWGEGQDEGGFGDTLTLALSLKGEGTHIQDARGLLRSARHVPARSGLERKQRRRFLAPILFPNAWLIFLALFLGLPGQAPAAEGLKCSPSLQVGRFRAPEIKECSGLAVSRKNPGLLWVHNDSGDTARLFAVKEDGSLRGIYHLAHADAVDWEDMAIGPCADTRKDCLYVGDIGDNRRQRPQVQVYRVEEPPVPLEGPQVEATLLETERFDCRYPDGPHNAETLFVDRAAGTPYLVTKEPAGEAATVYRFPGKPDPGKVVVLEKVSVLPSRPSLTGGDITDDGSLIVLRDYFAAYAYPRPEGSQLSEAFRSPPWRVPLGTEAQGEALGIAPSGTVIYTTSEGLGAPIHRTVCIPVRTQGTATGSSAGMGEGIE